jgi:hypothetical protein
MRKDEALDVVTPRRPRYRQDVEVTSNTAGEADRSIPRRGFGEHQIGTARPAWELVELRCPHDGSPSDLDQIAARRMS